MKIKLKNDSNFEVNAAYIDPETRESVVVARLSSKKWTDVDDYDGLMLIEQNPNVIISQDMLQEESDKLAFDKVDKDTLINYVLKQRERLDEKYSAKEMRKMAEIIGSKIPTSIKKKDEIRKALLDIAQAFVEG